MRQKKWDFDNPSKTIPFDGNGEAKFSKMWLGRYAIAALLFPYAGASVPYSAVNSRPDFSRLTPEMGV
jgi:hypothetical protein